MIFNIRNGPADKDEEYKRIVEMFNYVNKIMETFEEIHKRHSWMKCRASGLHISFQDHAYDCFFLFTQSISQIDVYNEWIKVNPHIPFYLSYYGFFDKYYGIDELGLEHELALLALKRGESRALSTVYYYDVDSPDIYKENSALASLVIEHKNKVYEEMRDRSSFYFLRHMRSIEFQEALLAYGDENASKYYDFNSFLKEEN